MTRRPAHSKVLENGVDTIVVRQGRTGNVDQIADGPHHGLIDGPQRTTRPASAMNSRRRIPTTFTPI